MKLYHCPACGNEYSDKDNPLNCSGIAATERELKEIRAERDRYRLELGHKNANCKALEEALIKARDEICNLSWPDVPERFEKCASAVFIINSLLEETNSL